MRKLLLIVLTTLSLYAEATFEQVQSMIGTGNYKQAVLALTIIAENHPNSSKVQYTLAQAQTGLGNLPAANTALDKALALNPKLDFVPADQVKQLQQALQPQVKLIKPVPTGPSTWEYLLVVLSFGIVGFLIFRKFSKCSTPTKTKTRKYPGYGFTAREKVPETQTTPYRKPDDTSSSVMATTSSYQPSYSKPTDKPSEVHHYYHEQSRGSDFGTTILASAATAVAVSTLMDDDSHSHRSDVTESYRPSTVSSNNSVSSSWNDSSTSSSSWKDTPSSSSKSDSWEDSTSTKSTSSSWSDSYSSSSDSWSSSSSCE